MILNTLKEQEVKAIVDFWLPRLGLDDWIITIGIHDRYYPGDQECEADIEDDIKYHQAALRIWRPFWDNDLQHRYKNIAHELVHLLLCRLHPHIPTSGDDILEEVVQTIAMLFYKKHAHEIEQ